MANVPRVSANAMVDPVMEMMKDLIQKENNRQILQTDLSPMETLLHYTDIFFRYQHKDPPETVKIWLQLLHNSLRQANGLFHRSRPRQSCLDCVVCSPGRLSKEIRDWNALFNHLYHGFQSDFQYIVLSGNAIAVDPVTDLLKDVIEKEDSRQILQIDLRPMESLLRDFTTLFQPMDSLLQIDLRPMDSLLRDFTTFFQPEKKALWEIMAAKFWLPLLLNYLTEAKGLLDSSAPGQSFIDSVSKEIREWTAYFNKVYHDFQSRLSIFVTSLQFLSSNPLHIEEKAEEPTVIQPLSRDEAWMLFRRVAFKDDQVSVDIQDNARRFADECKGMPFAINIVAAMIGQTNVDQWDTCFSLMKTVDPSFQATHPLLDAQLYRLLRWSYDALPNSNVKNCFLYCAFFMENQEVDSRELVQMWIGEGLVKSKQGTYLMDMALGRKYLQLLLDRCFFQIVHKCTKLMRKKNIYPMTERAHDVIPSIRVHPVIREMAMYIAQKEENCLFMASQNLRNFPEVRNNNCRRISVANNFIEHLPTHMRCAELASLILKGNTNLKELPSDFLLSLTSLRVLNLSGCTEITSLPTSMGQLKLLQFLSLSGLPIKYLPEEICNLSRLQFLNLSKCGDLESLPSKIAQLKNLKCLDLDLCKSLRVIPHEMSQLTSLSRLVFPVVFVFPFTRGLSMETEAPASIWSLKGLKNMTELIVSIREGQQLKDGIMGTWSEMRHLMLYYVSGDLPEDMKSMKKLQSFMLWGYWGSSLPNCKFEHLEVVSLCYCRDISDLSPLEWMPNLKLLKLKECLGLRELGIGSRGSGSPSGYQRLEKLVLNWLPKLESLGGASKRGVWDERTLPHLRVLKIRDCPDLKRFPVGMEKLQNLCALMGDVDWWRSIMWEDEDMKTKLEKNFKSY